MVDVVRVLNREIEEEEAADESADVVNPLSQPKSPVHTTVDVKRIKEMTAVKVGGGGRSGYAMSPNGSISAVDCRDYEDVSASRLFTVEVKSQLGNEGGELVGRGPRFWRKKWKLVEKMGDLIRGGQLLLRVVDERRRTLHKGKRGTEYVVALYAMVLGEGRRSSCAPRRWNVTVRR